MKTAFRAVFLAFVTLFLFTSCLSPSGQKDSDDIIVDFLYVSESVADGFIASSSVHGGKTVYFQTGVSYNICRTVRVEYRASAYREESGQAPLGTDENNSTYAAYDAIISSFISHRLSNETEPHLSGSLNEPTAPEETTAPTEVTTPEETIVPNETTVRDSETTVLDSDEIIVDFLYVSERVADGFIASSDPHGGKKVYFQTGVSYDICRTVRVEYRASAYREESGQAPLEPLETDENVSTYAAYDAIISSFISHRLSNETEPHLSGALNEPTAPEETTAPEDPLPSDTEIAYLYVSALGESGLIGSGTIRVDGKQMDVFVPLPNAHETYRLFDTVRIQYDPAMLLAESGTVSLEKNFNEPPSPTTYYEMRLTAILGARHADPAKGEPLYG